MKSGGQAVTNIGKGNWTDALRLEEGAARLYMSGRRSYVCTVRLMVNRVTTTNRRGGEGECPSPAGASTSGLR